MRVRRLTKHGGRFEFVGRRQLGMRYVGFNMTIPICSLFPNFFTRSA